MEGRYRLRNTVTYGFSGRLQRTGRPTGWEDGCGEAEIMYGYPMSPGDGHLIITAGGPMLPVSDGFGSRRRDAKSTGGRDMSAGSGLPLSMAWVPLAPGNILRLWQLRPEQRGHKKAQYKGDQHNQHHVPQCPGEQQRDSHQPRYVCDRTARSGQYQRKPVLDREDKHRQARYKTQKGRVMRQWQKRSSPPGCRRSKSIG